MIIFWTPLAIERLENIFEYISRDNKIAANKIKEIIFKKIESLSKFPESGRNVPEVQRKDIREIFTGEYRIIYRVDSPKIYILTIRNFKQLLPSDDLM